MTSVQLDPTALARAAGVRDEVRRELAAERVAAERRRRFGAGAFGCVLCGCVLCGCGDQAATLLCGATGLPHREYLNRAAEGRSLAGGVAPALFERLPARDVRVPAPPRRGAGADARAAYAAFVEGLREAADAAIRGAGRAKARYRGAAPVAAPEPCSVVSV